MHECQHPWDRSTCLKEQGREPLPGTCGSLWTPGCCSLGGRSVLSHNIFIPLCLYVPLLSISCPLSSPQRMRGWFPAPCVRSHWSTQFFCALLGEQWGGCQPQGAWQRVMTKLPAACRVIPDMRVPWSASQECQSSSSEAVQLAISSKQHYASLSSKCAHSVSLGTVRLREKGWVDQCMDERHCPVRLIILPLTFDCRVFMPNLVPPKIPDGERLDFDVSSAVNIKPWELIPSRCSSTLCPAALQLLAGFTHVSFCPMFLSGAGHPPQAHGEGPE